jgi:voltage-gated potassium channel Kch
MSGSRVESASIRRPRAGPANKSAGLLASPTRNLIGGLIYMAVVMAVATAAYVGAGWSLGDALYMVIITVYTVGFDEVRPIDTTLLRTITISNVVLGCTGVIFLTGALIQFITLNQFQQVFGIKRMTTQIDKLSGHVIICGFGRIGRMLARELTAGGADLVILERNEALAEEVRGQGYLCVHGDATDEGALQAAGVMRARWLASVLPQDAANVFITLTARGVNRSLEIIARGEAPSTEAKLLQAGANRVVLPTHIGAERIAEMILYAKTSEMLLDPRMREFDDVLHRLGLDMDVATAARDSPAVGMTVEALEKAADRAFFVVQVTHVQGDPISNPDPKTVIEAGDGLVLIGRAIGSRHLFEPLGGPNAPLLER